MTEHLLTDYRTHDGIRVSVYVPANVPRAQPAPVQTAIIVALASAAVAVRTALEMTPEEIAARTPLDPRCVACGQSTLEPVQFSGGGLFHPSCAEEV